MAQELVLVPKIKYEYLLKKVGEAGSGIQNGKGKVEENDASDIQREENNVNKMYKDLKTEHSPESKTFKLSNSESDPDSNQHTSKKPNLFVEAPLSKMGFIENSKKKGKTRKISLKSSVSKRTIASKSHGKTKWINYTI